MLVICFKVISSGTHFTFRHCTYRPNEDDGRDVLIKLCHMRIKEYQGNLHELRKVLSQVWISSSFSSESRICSSDSFIFHIIFGEGFINVDSFACITQIYLKHCIRDNIKIKYIWGQNRNHLPCFLALPKTRKTNWWD